MAVSNRQIAKAFRLASQLMELHNENPFKIRSLQNAAFKIEKLGSPLSEMQLSELSSLEGIGKGLQTKITDYLVRESFLELDDYLSKTPVGVVDMLSIKGIGPKKVFQLWKELEIESVGELLYACNENRLIALKGFGDKTQKLIQSNIEFRLSNQSFCLYPVAEIVSNEIISSFEKLSVKGKISSTGELRRKCEVISVIDFLVSTNENELTEFLLKQDQFKDQKIKMQTVQLSDKQFQTLNLLYADSIAVRFFLSSEESYGVDLFLTSGSEDHLKIFLPKINFLAVKQFKSEIEIYNSIELDYIIPELREGKFEMDIIEKGKLNDLVELKDLKGILHNHSNYSDGNDSLREMAVYCKELGYEYFGICDHSKSAFYANGLREETILKQHKEIDLLNKELFPFRIFKGIESDILSSGELDYEENILKSFDFIVASIHSNLRMDIDKATSRLITAIENPYTTILGHPTGRLLLSRAGYPIDHQKIIDACSANNVVIELNANPYRLDIDWRWIQAALSKNVKISINPDAHRKEGYHDMYYGVGIARKGGLWKEMTFNALSCNEIEKWFDDRKV